MSTIGRLDGKVALVTGGASGMGAAHARGIVAEGGRVVIGDIADDAGRTLAAELGDAAVYAHLDVTSYDDWEMAVLLAEKRFGRLNVLVNNAGILNAGSLDDFTVAQWDLAMNVNAKGAFLGLKASVEALRRGKPASVVNISSAAGMHGIAGMHAYTASKYAVRGLTKSAGPRAGRAGCPCQFGPPRQRRHAHDRGHAGQARARGPGQPPASVGPPQRGRGAGRLPCQRRVIVLHGS